MEHSWKENCFFISFWFNKTTDTLCLPLRLHRYVWNIHFSKLCVLLFHISYSRWENCMSKRTGQSGSPALSKQRLLECEIWKGPWHLSSRSTSNLTFPFAFEISSPWKTVRGKTQVLTRTVAVVKWCFPTLLLLFRISEGTRVSRFQARCASRLQRTRGYMR